MLEKREPQSLSSRRSTPGRQSASKDLNAKNCCWCRLLGSDIDEITVPFSLIRSRKSTMGRLKLVLEVDRKSFQKPLANAGHTSASITNCSNWGATDLKIHTDIFVVHDRIENR